MFCEKKMKDRKRVNLAISIVLSVIMILTSLSPAFAWDTDDLSSKTWPYMMAWTNESPSPYGNVMSIRDDKGNLYPYSDTLLYDVIPVMYYDSDEVPVLTPVTFYIDSEGKRTNNSSFTPIDSLPADFSRPVKYFVRSIDGRGYPMFIMFDRKSSSSKNTDAEIDAIIEYVTPGLLDTLREYNEKLEVLYQARKSGELRVGDYHPVHFNLLYYIGSKGLSTGFGTSIDGTTYSLLEDFNAYANDAEVQLKEILNKFKYSSNQAGINKRSIVFYKALLETVAPFYLDYVEQNKISDPVIESFSVGSSKGVIDYDAKTVYIRFPEGTDLDELPYPEIVTAKWTNYKLVAGSVSSRKAVYSVVPYEESTGIVYDGVRDKHGFNMGVDLSQLWKIKVETGDPYNLVTSFSIRTSDGVLRQASIDEDSKTITLNLPVGTDLTSITPLIEHTGTSTSMDGGSIDFTNPQTLTVYNSEYGLETVYQVTVTAHESSEKDITYFSVDGAEGTINGADISVTIPYATDLPNARVDISISEFAEITESPAQLAEGENSYTIRAEDGSTKTYTVTIIRTPAATGCSIESFSYGSAKAVIDEVNGTIDLTLPAGTSLSFAPDIVVSEFATVEPASGVVQDFSKPVEYSVTAENGAKKVYIVTVSVSSTPVSNEYKDTLQNVVARIISRYSVSASDDWEWMDLGFYQNIEANSSDGFSIENTIGTLDSTTNVAMTNIARKIMTLTARGFDCRNLSQYNNGDPYTDRNGNEIDDLISVMYNYGGSYTINGPVFALLALDMGNYTIPDGAVWTREKLIETLLAHVYLSDNFGTDMVGAIMYALAPYSQDPVLGERVRAKLDEGLTILIRNMESDSYAFKAWGAANSETADWAIMALNSIGIDPHTDPRFSDGDSKSVIQYWVDNFVNTSGYFHHTTSVMNNAMATYEGCYAAMWYLGFLDNGGAGHPYSLYYHRFDFSTVLSSDASILTFELEGKQGVIEEGAENSITVTLSNGTPLANMKPEIVLAEGAKLIAPSFPVTFVEGVPQPFTVCAEDGKTYKTYFVTVVYDDVLASGAELDINSLVLQNSVLNDEAILSKSVTTASDGATEILLTVKPGVNTSKMYLSVDVSYAAVCDPVLDGSKQMDLSDWLTVTVTSEDGTNINVYRIKVVAKGQAEITSFEVEAGGIWYSGTIDNVSNTITVRDVDDSKLTSTVLETRIVFTGLTCSPTSGVATDFASSVTYTLGGSSELASRSYTVNVLNKSGQHITANSGSGDPSGGTDDPSGPSGGNTASGARILGLTVLGKEAVIDENAGTIVITLPKETDVSAVALDITLSEGASSDPSSGQIVNLSSPLAITVRNGVEVKQYVISVVLERSISEKLWDEMLEESDVVDHQISHGRGIH